MEKKGCFLGLYIQPTLMVLVDDVKREESMNNSEYLRALVIADLLKRKKLTADLMADMLTGETLRQVRRIQQAATAPAHA